MFKNGSSSFRIIANEFNTLNSNTSNNTSDIINEKVQTIDTLLNNINNALYTSIKQNKLTTK